MRFNYKETHYHGDFGGTDVTHEAAIGSIDRKQMETLMAKGLDEDEAVGYDIYDIIVRGILR